MEFVIGILIYLAFGGLFLGIIGSLDEVSFKKLPNAAVIWLLLGWPVGLAIFVGALIVAALKND